MKKADTQENKYDLKVLLDRTTIQDIMSEKVVSVKIDAPFYEVYGKMKEHGVRHLPVIDEQGVLAGIITQRDLYKIVSPRKLIDGQWYYDKEMLNNIILKHVMVKKPYTLNPTNSVGKALMKMVYSKFGCIPIVDDDGRLCGIVTRTDILKRAAQIYSG